jgi:hypothetical protein
MTRKVLIVGDSHMGAIKTALEEYSSTNDSFTFSTIRLPRKDAEPHPGEIRLPQVIERFAADPEEIALVMALRGNQYNTLGLIQHPRPFDIEMADVPVPVADEGVEMIPVATMDAYFRDSLRSGYGKHLVTLAQSSKVPVLCLQSPAPKEDNGHILQGAETFFVANGVSQFGVSPPALRLKLWTLQSRALAELCAEIGITFLPNPEGTRDSAGFLSREFYAGDATHANERYGRLVLQQISDALSERTGD